MMKPRWYQDECCDKLLERVAVKGVHPIGAIPTGAGKTIIISMMIEKWLAKNPNKSVIVLSHVKEILEQNHASIEKYLGIDVGLYSAMLNSRDIKNVTVCGIQSVYKRYGEFKNVGLIIIDEVHLVTDENSGMYRKFLAEFNCNFIGLTATPFRTRGYLHQIPNALFTEIAYDLTSSDNFRRLIKEGYLSKLFSKGTSYKMDTKGIAIQAGDFANKQLEKRFNTDEVTEIALDEVVKTGKNYKKWLIFAISIDHAEAITEYLNENNINTAIVHSKMEEDRDVMLDGFRSGFYRAIVNVNVLTTGIDIPDIDLIVMLRPTKSPIIYAQSVGRGLRVAEGKDHCLVLDFANNVATHGPVDDIQVINKGEKKKGEAITKECPKCQCINYAAAPQCIACGYTFPVKVKIQNTASDLDILKKTKKAWANVTLMTVSKHKKTNRPDSIRIDYICGLRRFSDWAAIKSNSGYAAGMAKGVLKKFYDFPEGFDYTVENILEISDKFKKPKRIFVDHTERYPRIEKIDFGEDDE